MDSLFFLFIYFERWGGLERKTEHPKQALPDSQAGAQTHEAWDPDVSCHQTLNSTDWDTQVPLNSFLENRVQERKILILYFLGHMIKVNITVTLCGIHRPKNSKWW